MTLNFFLLGLTFGSGPCLAACGPVLISYIAGAGKDTLKGLISYIIFSLSRISVYLVIGILFFYLGRIIEGAFLGGFSKYMYIAGGGFIVFIGTLMSFGKRIELNLRNSLYNKMLNWDKKNVALLGVIFGLLPCAPLLALFSYSALVSKSLFLSLLYILAFGIGTMLSPLLFLVILAGLIPRLFLNKSPNYAKTFNFICGLIIIVLGIQLIIKAF